MIRFLVGLDLGQIQDHSALVVLEVVEVPTGAVSLVSGRERKDQHYHVRHIQRFALGTPYPDVALRVKEVMVTAELKGRTALLVDATGVGRPVIDLLRQAGIRPLLGITITAGDSISRAGSNWRVPKRDLVSTLSILLQSERLKVAQGLPLADLLLQELLNFKVKIDPLTAHDSYGAWREGLHDDLVLATALACWYGEQVPRLGIVSG